MLSERIPVPGQCGHRFERARVEHCLSYDLVTANALSAVPT